MKIPVVDIKTENLEVKAVCLKKINRLVDTSNFTLGQEVKEFEKSFAKFCGVKYCLGVGSGTDALRTALFGCGISPGDEVITTDISYTSTSLAIVHCGATPIFIDVLGDGNIDHSKIEVAITKKTKAILITHMYGNICEMVKIRAIAKKRNLLLIDDCAHAHGASYGKEIAGSLADISCFSFYPTKNLGAWGDGGAITTNNKKLLDQSILFKNYGERVQNYSEVTGYNSKLDTIQALVLLEKIKRLKAWNLKRSLMAQFYTEELKRVGDIFTIPFSKSCSYYNFPIKTKHRKALASFLDERGIKTAVRYPVPMHLQRCFRYLGYKRSDFPMAKQHASSVLSLPIYTSLSKEAQLYVVDTIKEFFGA